MGKKTKQKFTGHRKKRQTAITFDENERSNYLKNMIGAKKRRR